MAAPPPGNLPINRSAAYQPNPQDPPKPRLPKQREARIAALRDQLRYAYALAYPTVEYHLEQTKWDVNKAALHFWEAEARFSNGQPSERPPEAEPRGRRDLTVGQSRITRILYAQSDMRIEVDRRKKEFRPNPAAAPPVGQNQLDPHELTNAEMALLQHDHRWIPEEAKAAVDEIIAGLIQGEPEYRGPREQLKARMMRMRSMTESPADKDGRLALLISITSTNSWWSARALLAGMNWDLALALDTWMSEGAVPFDRAPTKRKYRGVETQVYENCGLRGFNADRPPRPQAGQPNLLEEAIDPQMWNQSRTARRRKIARGQTKRLDRLRRGETVDQPDDYMDWPVYDKRGFVIDEDMVPASVNAPNASKLRVEWIEGLVYGMRTFKGRHRDQGPSLPFRWTDGANPTQGQVEFDWMNQKHITQVNDWRKRQWWGLLGTAPYGGMNESFNKYEKLWLVDQIALHRERHFVASAGNGRNTNTARYRRAVAKFEDSATFPLPFSGPEMTKLAVDFNKQFAGQRFYTKQFYRQIGNTGKYELISRRKDMSRVGHVPRQIRSKEVLDQERRRIKSISKNFLVTLASTKERDMNTSPEDYTSEEDSDFPQMEARHRRR